MATPFNLLLRITSGQLFIPGGWASFSRKAYVEPIMIRDGFHDYVLMSAAEYQELTEPKHTTVNTISADLAAIAPTLAAMAKIGVPPQPE